MNIAKTLCRAFFYIVFLITMNYVQKSQNDFLLSIFSGFLFADLMTWIIFTVIDIPGCIIGSTIDFFLNIIVLYIAIKIIHIELPKDLGNEAVFFLVFLLTLGLKIFWRKLNRIQSED
ncbi:MAG TPA: hypothetical protein DD381_05755 [Lentisphaeria bacterium]|nr:MAG: hypothetical protein A2X47_08355 [Lentisphaerae bacterium GWF2_38_69]HBM15830.1 hypothetical protein [Lentisphaeria bacterium]